MSWATSQDAEEAFYTALASRDTAAMQSLWLDSPEVVCIHPGQPRLQGFQQILDSWNRILTGGQRLRLEIAHRRIVSDGTIAVHHLTEVMTDRATGGKAEALTTNVYRNTENGWRIVMHHASPASISPDRAETSAPEKATLH